MHAQVLRAVSQMMPYLGEVEEGVALADRAIALDPHLPPGNKNGLIDANFYARRFDRVIAIASSMPDETRARWTWIHLAMSYGYLGQTAEAEMIKAAFVSRYGEISGERWLNEGQAYARQQEQDLFIEGLRKIGMPVCASAEYLVKITKPVRLPQCIKE